MRIVRLALQWILSLAIAGCAGLIVAYMKPWNDPSLYGYLLFALCSLTAVICINPIFAKLQLRSSAASFFAGLLALGITGVCLFEAENYRAWRFYRDGTLSFGLHEKVENVRIDSAQFSEKSKKPILSQNVDIQADRITAGPAGVMLDDRQARAMTWKGCNCSDEWEQRSHIYFHYHRADVTATGAGLIVYPLAVRAKNVGVGLDGTVKQRAALTEAYLNGAYLRFSGQSMNERFPLKDADTAFAYTGNGGAEEVSSGLVPVSFLWQSYGVEGQRLVREMQGESQVTASLYDGQDRLIVTLVLPTRALPAAHQRLLEMTKHVQSGDIVKPFNPFWNYRDGKEP